MLDTQGRIKLPEAFVKSAFDGQVGDIVMFSKEDDPFTFRVYFEDDKPYGINEVCRAKAKIDSKFRIIVPKVIREVYTRHALFYNEGNELYLRFFALATGD